MTEKLYYADSHLFEFDATVTACRAAESGWEVELDRSAFFPNEGGQYADTGTLDDAAVSDVQLRGDTLVHITDRPLQVGSRCHGSLNADERLRKMQNHTGEHIVSGLVHRQYGLNNIGFHLGHDDVTLDFDGPLDRGQLDFIEQLANGAVAACAKVTARFPSDDELATLNYRSKLELTEQVRIVTIDGYDCCACCAPHVDNCGEVGLIKLLDFARYKGGVRVHMQCGFDALDDYREKYRVVEHIALALSAKQSEADAAFDKLMSDYDARGREVAALKRQLALSKLPHDSVPGDMVLIEQGLDARSLRQLADAAADKCGGTVYAFSGEGGSYNFVVASRSRDVRPTTRLLCDRFDGRGGGSEAMTQGRITADEQSLRKFLDDLNK